MNTEAPPCGLTATAMTALVDAVRAGDIEAAQALLPVDPIVKRAREICARHCGAVGGWTTTANDGTAIMQAVVEALRTIDEDDVLRMARAATYAASPNDPGRVRYLNGDCDNTTRLKDVRFAIQAALVGNPPVVPAMTA